VKFSWFLFFAVLAASLPVFAGDTPIPRFECEGDADLCGILRDFSEVTGLRMRAHGLSTHGCSAERIAVDAEKRTAREETVRVMEADGIHPSKGRQHAYNPSCICEALCNKDSVMLGEDAGVDLVFGEGDGAIIESIEVAPVGPMSRGELVHLLSTRIYYELRSLRLSTMPPLLGGGTTDSAYVVCSSLRAVSRSRDGFTPRKALSSCRNCSATPP